MDELDKNLNIEATAAPNVQSIQERLLYEMRFGCYKNAAKLPCESLLAKALNISRTQLRDTLAELYHDGVISRRQGVGTIINRHVLYLSTRMDIDMGYEDMIQKSGREPKMLLIRSGILRSAQASEKMGTGRLDELLYVSRIITANGKPAVYCEEHIPKRLIRRGGYTDADLEKPIRHFLGVFCGLEPCTDVREVHAVSASGNIAKSLSVPDGTPLLQLDEVDYDFDGKPIMYSRQFCVEGTIAHHVVRRKI